MSVINEQVIKKYNNSIENNKLHDKNCNKYLKQYN